MKRVVNTERILAHLRQRPPLLALLEELLAYSKWCYPSLELLTGLVVHPVTGETVLCVAVEGADSLLMRDWIYTMEEWWTDSGAYSNMEDQILFALSSEGFVE